MTPDQFIVLYLFIAMLTATVLLVKLDAMADVFARIAAADGDAQEAEDAQETGNHIRHVADSPLRPLMCLFAGMLWPVLAVITLPLVPLMWRHRAQ